MGVPSEAMPPATNGIVQRSHRTMNLPNAIMNSAPANPFADWEPDYKDVYELDPVCEQSVIPCATRGFREAGYDVRQAEKVPYHPVYRFRLKRLTAPRFVHERDLEHHVLEILAGVGLSVPKDTSGADRNGDRILVAFMWEPDAIQKGKSRRARVVS